MHPLDHRGRLEHNDTIYAEPGDTVSAVGGDVLYVAPGDPKRLVKVDGGYGHGRIWAKR